LCGFCDIFYESLELVIILLLRDHRQLKGLKDW